VEEELGHDSHLKVQSVPGMESIHPSILHSSSWLVRSSPSTCQSFLITRFSEHLELPCSGNSPYRLDLEQFLRSSECWSLSSRRSTSLRKGFSQ
ncbi:hypothetical protein PFISCL1PPCAC_21178, partial [Pristionchus fissidentatus]